MKKTLFLLSLLAAAGLASVWFLSKAATHKQNDETAWEANSKAQEGSKDSKKELGKFFDRAATVLDNAEKMQAKSAPPENANPGSQDEWQQNEAKRELNIREQQERRIEKDKEILADTQGWKEKQRAKEKDRQLKQLARIEELRLTDPAKYQMKLKHFEERRAERMRKFEERLDKRLERFKERVQKFNESES